MAVDATTFEIRIKASDQTKAGMDAAKKNATELSKTLAALGSGGQSAFSRMQASIISLNQTLDLFGRISRGTAQAIQTFFGAGIELQKGVAGISTLFDSTSQSTRQLTNDIIALQRQFGTQQTDLVQGYYEAIASGAVEAGNATAFMMDAQKLAIGGMTSLATAVDGLTSIIGAYGVSVRDAGRINDALFIGAAAGKTNIEQLASSLGQAAAMAKASGVSYQEYIAAVSAITAGGVQTSEAVTQVRSAMMGLSNQTEFLQSVLQKLNITSMQAEVSQNGLVETLRKILSQTDGTTESLTTLFGRVEAVNAVLALTNDTIGVKYKDIMAEMATASENVGARTDKAFTKMTNTIAFRIDQTKARLRTMFAAADVNAIVGPAIDAFNQLLDVFEKMASAIQKIDFKKLADDLTTLSIAVGVVALGFKAWATYLSAGSIATAVQYVAEIGWLLAKDAGMYAWAAAKWIGIAAAIAAAVAALDIFIRNIKNLPAVWNLIVETLSAGALYFERTILSMTISAKKLGVAFRELLLSYGVGSKAAIDQQNEAIQDQLAYYDELTEKIGESKDAVVEASQSVDLGFFGDVFKSALKFVDDYNQGISKTGGLLKDLKKIGPALPEPPAEAKRRTPNIPQLIGTEQMTLVGDVFGKAGQSFAGSINGVFSKAIGGFAGVLNLFLEAFKAILNFLPNIVNTMGDIMQMLTDLPNTFYNANKRLWNETERFLSDFLPNLADVLVESFDMVEALPERFFKAFEKTLQKMDVIFQNVTVAVVRAFTTHIPRLILMITTVLGKELPKIGKYIWEGLLKALPEIGNMLVEDLKKFANDFAKFLNLRPPFKIDEKSIDDGLKKLQKTLSKSASDVFSVMDLEAAGRGMDVADRIRNAIGSSVDKAQDIFTRLWRELEKAWRRIWNDIAKPFTDAWNAIVEAWRFIWDGTITAVTGTWNLVVEIWRQVWDGAVYWATQVWNVIVEVWRAVWDGSVTATTATWNIIVAIWRAVWDGSVTATTQSWELLVETWRALWDGTIKLITDAWKAIVDGIANFKFPSMPSFSWPEMPRFSWPDIPKPNWLASSGGFFLPSSGSIMNKVGDAYRRSDAGKIMGRIGLQTGGMALPQGKWLNGKLYAETGAIAQGTDVIPAQLTPGEFVVNREAARSNLGLLSFMNQVKAPLSPVGSTQNFSVVINTKTDLSPEQIKREVIPTLEKELRRKSQDGKFVIATSGIRTSK